MTKLTKNQKASIVRLFVSGTGMANLAEAYRVTQLKIEGIIREAMTSPIAEDGLKHDSNHA